MPTSFYYDEYDSRYTFSTYYELFNQWVYVRYDPSYIINYNVSLNVNNYDFPLSRTKIYRTTYLTDVSILLQDFFFYSQFTIPNQIKTSIDFPLMDVKKYINEFDYL